MSSKSDVKEPKPVHDLSGYWCGSEVRMSSAIHTPDGGRYTPTFKIPVYVKVHDIDGDLSCKIPSDIKEDLKQKEFILNKWSLRVDENGLYLYIEGMREAVGDEPYRDYLDNVRYYPATCVVKLSRPKFD